MKEEKLINALFYALMGFAVVAMLACIACNIKMTVPRSNLDINYDDYYSMTNAAKIGSTVFMWVSIICAALGVIIKVAGVYALPGKEK